MVETREAIGEAPGPLSGNETWLIHLYRALSAEALTWRQRLDVTANWAVPLFIAITTFALGDPRMPHAVLIVLGSGLIAVAASIEAERFRYVREKEWRAQLLEARIFAPLLEGAAPGGGDWRAELARELRSPQPAMGLWTALRLRMRRLYLALFYLLILVWLVKGVVHPEPSADWAVVLARFSLAGWVPGAWVLGALGVAALLLSLVCWVAPREGNI